VDGLHKQQVLVELLRQGWDARGAVDLATIEIVFAGEVGYSQDQLDRALRSFDR
jgi:hypothetical protein